MLKKVKKIKNLIKIKKTFLKEEEIVLVQIEIKKQEVMSRLKEIQREYLEKVKKINSIRVSSNRVCQDLYEGYASKVRNSWMDVMLKFREISEKKTEQAKVVLKLKKEVRKIEILLEKNEKEFKLKIEKKANDINQENMITKSFLGK